MAKALNPEGWKPEGGEFAYGLMLEYSPKITSIVKSVYYHNNYGLPQFKTFELAQQAIEILGEKIIFESLNYFEEEN